MQTLLALDLAGTFVFAISGAMAGVKHRLDLFGVLVLSFVAANTGGIARDVLIGAVPPPALSNWRYVAVSLLAGVVTFFCYGTVDRLHSPELMFDAAGLALFAVAGAQKAVALGLGPVPAALLGMLTGIGGVHGARRDAGGDPHGAARRLVRRRRPGRRGGGGDRRPAPTPVHRGDGRGRGALLRDPLSRDPPRLAAPRRPPAREDGRLERTTGQHREGALKVRFVSTRLVRPNGDWVGRAVGREFGNQHQECAIRSFSARQANFVVTPAAFP
jgi:hypothetical protein